MHETPSICLTNVAIDRGGKLLISELRLDLSGPKLLWVVGGNGIGKTSLLKTCAGLSRPSAGQVEFSLAGKPVTPPEIISFLPASSYAKPRLTAWEEAQFWGADLQTTEITEHGQTLTQNLSTGQAKRLSFAKLLAQKKPIWILDEPLSGLDQKGRDLIAQSLQDHVTSGGLALVASHADIPVKAIPTQRLTLG